MQRTPHVFDTRPYYRAPRHAERGMSLVEIMVVIAIIGGLMTVIGVTVIGQLDQANADTTVLQMNQIDKGLQMYAIKNRGNFPSTADGLNAAVAFFPSQDVPVDAWGNEFVYLSPGPDGQPYELISYGKDGSEGGDGAGSDLRYSEQR